jgi:hypothetical protein
VDGIAKREWGIKWVCVIRGFGVIKVWEFVVGVIKVIKS